MKRVALIATLFILSGKLPAQTGFDYLTLPSSASAAVNGGTIVSHTLADLAVWFDNPALLDSSTVGSFLVSANPFFSDINRYVTSVSLSPRWTDQLAVGLVYNQLGTYDRLDNAGNSLGTFTARSYVLQAGGMHQVGPFAFGVSAKFSQILLEQTRASALLTDIGGVYRGLSRQLVIGLAIRNFGVVLNQTAGLSNAEIPFDVVAGVSFKPLYMPFRFTLTAYDIDQIGSLQVPSQINREQTFSRPLRFLNIGTALVLGQLLELQIGYNYRRNEMLRIPSGSFGAGWSFGMKVLFDRWQLLIARSTYHAAGGTTFLTLQSNYQSIKNIF